MKATVGFALLLAVEPVSAQQMPEGFSAGIGISGGQDAFVGNDDDIAALPILRYDSDAVSIGFPEGIRVTAIDRQEFRLSGVLSPRLSAIDSADAAELDGIDRAVTADGGLLMEYRAGRGTRLSLRSITELTDKHGGSEIRLGANQTVPLGKLPVTFGVGVSWQSSDLASYVYGVKSSEAIAGRSAYALDDIVVPYVSVGLSHPLSDTTRITANVRADFLPDDVQNSPIVNEDVTIGAFIGLSYSFR